MDRFPRSDSIVQPRAGLQTYMAQVYGWMTVGLLLTAFVAWYAANSAAVMELLFTNRVFLIGLIIAQLALVIVLSAMIQKLSAGVTTMLFMLYSALTGLTLSSKGDYRTVFVTLRQPRVLFSYAERLRTNNNFGFCHLNLRLPAGRKLLRRRQSADGQNSPASG